MSHANCFQRIRTRLFAGYQFSGTSGHSSSLSFLKRGVWLLIAGSLGMAMSSITVFSGATRFLLAGVSLFLLLLPGTLLWLLAALCKLYEFLPQVIPPLEEPQLPTVEQVESDTEDDGDGTDDGDRAS